MERVYYSAAALFPKWFQTRIKTLLIYCGSDMGVEVWIGRAVIVSGIVFAFCTTLFYFIIENFWTAEIILICCMGIFHTATYLMLFFKAESRARAVEKVLPNMLHLIAANLNSGMTPFQAFQASSRQEFGVLKEETDRVIALTLSSMPFRDALGQMPERIKSPILKNVVELFIEGMRTGSPLATLLSDIAIDIYENLDLRKEIVTRSKSYILFIGFIVVLGGPLLSAVSIHFIRTITDIIGQVTVEIPEFQNIGGISIGELTLTPDFLIQVTTISIALTALIASWLLAIIAEGKDKYLVKYFIFILPLSEFVFFTLDYLIRTYV